MPAAPSALPVLHPPEWVARPWRVNLLGRIEARRGEQVITRFQTLPTAALLARLVLQPQRMHPREELAECLWPGIAADVGRNRLRQALSTLKRLLEAEGDDPARPLIVADRLGLRLREGAFECDVLDFERAVREQRHADARATYCGELLPGLYGEWVQEERSRLAAVFEGLDAAPAVAAAAPAESPAAPPAALSLPQYLNPLYGREADHAALAAAVQTHRLVTLIGPGGAGKTRLASTVAARMNGINGFDSVAWVPLADCHTLSQAAAQCCTALQLPLTTAGAVAQLAQALRQQHVLLVMDNVEQLVASGGPELVDQLLQRVPGLHVLVTSRRALGLPGERELPLSPLPVPAAGAGLDELLGNPGAALFIDRARAVQPGFSVDADNHAALGAICRALEGLPLALELAAARTRGFTLRELHDALARPLGVLERTGAGVGRAPRHDSLRAAIEWSWRLLSPPVQRFLAALSVFRGGCTAADAEAVCQGSDAPETAPLSGGRHGLAARDALEALVADSLLRTAADASGALRFHPFEAVREFAAAQLGGAERRALRQRHRARVLALALAVQAQGAAQIADEHLPNVQQALRTALEDGQAGLGLTLGLALAAHWQSQGIAPEPLALLRQAAEQAQGSAALRVPACVLLAQLSLQAGDLPGARRLAEQGLVDAGGQPRLRSMALCGWARVVLDGERSADGLDAPLDEALALAAGDPELQARALTLKAGIALRHRHQPARALQLIEQARQLFAAAGLHRDARRLGHERALCLRNLGRFEEALTAARQHEADCRAHGELSPCAAAINLQGVVLAEQRRWTEALQAYGRCLNVALQHRADYWVAFALWNHCRNLARLRQADAAARLMAFSERYWTTHYTPLDVEAQRFLRRVWRLVNLQLGPEPALAAWQAGQLMTQAQAIALAQRSRAALGGQPPRAVPPQPAVR